MKPGVLLALASVVSACGAGAPPAPVSATASLAPTPAAVAAPSASPATRPCDLTVGSAQVAIPRSKLVALGLSGSFPDGIFGVLRDGERYSFYAARAFPATHARSIPPGMPTNSTIARMVGTLDDPTAFQVTPNIPVTGVKAPLDYLGGGPIYRDAASGMMLLFYHAERWPKGMGSQFWASYGIARSMDAGASWVDLGEFYTPEVPFVDDVPVGTAAGARSVPVPAAAYLIVNGFFYVYAKDRASYDTPVSFLTVARAPVADVISAAQRGIVSPWMKYYRGTWTEPGLGGKASQLENGNPAVRNSDVVFSQATGRYLMVVIGAVNADNDGVYLIESSDGLVWGPRRAIDEGPRQKLFPTIVGLGSDPRVVGEQFYLYYPNDRQNQPDTDILRRSITCR